MTLPAHAEDTKSIALILDASGSMNGKLADGTPKITAAKQAVSTLVGKLPAATRLGFRAYGHQSHRSRKDCKDTQLLVNFGPADEAGKDVLAKMQPLKAQGYTPISYVLKHSASDIGQDASQKRTIVLVSDGKETCEGDPCAVARALSKADAKLTIHTIGFGVDLAAKFQLQCIAKVAGGNYYDASDAEGLSGALAQASVAELPKAEGQEIVIKIKKPKFGFIAVKNANYHTIADAELDKKVATVTRSNPKVKLPPGVYKVNFGKKVWWNSVNVTAGETTVLNPGQLVINKNQYHSILDQETGKVITHYGSSNKRVVLMPGKYDVTFGDGLWRDVELKEGATTTLDPAQLVIAQNQYHLVRDPETGKKVHTYNSSSKRLAMVPGAYDVMFGKSKWRVNLKGGETKILKPGQLVINNHQYHDIQNPKTGKKVNTYTSSTKRLAMAPGTYDVLFGKTSWRFQIKAGENKLLNAGGVKVVPGGYYYVYDSAGKKIGNVSRSSKFLALPPGNFAIRIAEQEVPLNIKEGKIITLKLE